MDTLYYHVIPIHTLTLRSIQAILRFWTIRVSTGGPDSRKSDVVHARHVSSLHNYTAIRYFFFFFLSILLSRPPAFCIHVIYHNMCIACSEYYTSWRSSVRKYIILCITCRHSLCIIISGRTRLSRVDWITHIRARALQLRFSKSTA